MYLEAQEIKGSRKGHSTFYLIPRHLGWGQTWQNLQLIYENSRESDAQLYQEG